MDTVNKRLAAIRERIGVNKSAFAGLIGIEASRYNKLENGKGIPAGDALMLMAENLPTLNLTWLLTGTGSMFTEDKVLTPFVPGAEQGLLGSEFVQPGALASIYGANFGEDEDSKKPQAETPTDAKSFIKMLLAENEALKKSDKAKDQIILEQREALTEAREALKESRENAQFLRAQLVAKAEGNHEAPGADATVPVASLTEVHMQCSRCTGTESGIVAMYPATQQQLRMAS